MPNPIDDNERLAIAVGRAVSTWAHAEIHLATIFSILTGMDHTMAVTVFRHFRSVPNQRDMLLSVARVSTRCDEQDLAKLLALLSGYSTLAGKRNDLAHNPFGWESGKELKIYRMKREKVSRPGMFPYSRAPIDVAEIETLIDEIKALVIRIAEFGRDLSEKLRRPTPLADQILALEENMKTLLNEESPPPRGLLDF